MQKIRLAFATDRHQNLEQDIVRLINEALSKKNFDVFWFEFNKVKRVKGKTQLPLRKVSSKIRKLTKTRMLTRDPAKYTDLSFVDALMIKKDPPQDHKILKLLSKTDKKLFIFNHPEGIIKYESKKYLKNFRKFTAKSFFSRNVRELEKAVKSFGDCVLKKEIGFGGKGVYHVFSKGRGYYGETNKTKKPRKIDLRKLLNRLTHNGKRELVVVKFLKRVGHGDKRILILDNHVLGSILRVPGHKKGWVCNISSGGSIKKTRLTKEEKRLLRMSGKGPRKTTLTWWA